MKVELQTTRQDYIEFYKLQLKNNFKKRIIVFAVLAFFVVSVVSGDHFTFLKCIYAVIGYAVFVAAIMYYIPLWIAIIRLNKQISKEKAFIEKREFSITDEGLKSEGSGFSLLRNWQSIKSTGVNEKFVYIHLVDKSFLIIPKRFFTSDTEATNFLGLIQSKNPQINPFFNPINTLNPKPPYKWGFLCLIPLIGAIAGLVLILQGIFKYKDKWLVLIGIGGIAFTVLVYGSLYYVGFKSDFGKGQFGKISQMQMNTLVKQIEFYKIQHGVYPDSLQQIESRDEFISIDDPLLNDKKHSTYNYHRIGNKYTLFSSGPDEIPNTKDDIYPSIKIDTSKIGLIIKRPNIK